MSNPVNWFDLLPESIAARQIAWEKRRRVWFAVQSGATRQVIADHLGVSAARIQQLVERARDRRWGYAPRDTSPAAAFLSRDLTTELNSLTLRGAGGPRTRQKRVAKHFAQALVTAERNGR